MPALGLSSCFNSTVPRESGVSKRVSGVFVRLPSERARESLAQDLPRMAEPTTGRFMQRRQDDSYNR